MKYLRLIQLSQFCGPTCIQMILLNKGVQADQEEIAKALDIKIRNDRESIYSQKFKSLPPKNNMLGLKFEDFYKQEIIDSLKKYDLTYTLYPFNSLNEPAQIINKALSQNKHIMANFYLEPINGKIGGHYVLIESIKGNKLTICDPSSNSRSPWQIDCLKLIKAMGKYANRERGLIIFD